MTFLVADVGGTNTRVAWIAAGLPVLAERFSNDEYSSVEAVLAQYQTTRDMPPLTGCAIAIAGPVTSGHARLTNRDWRFDRQSIAAALSLPGAKAVYLLNDLAALGYSLAGLAPSQLTQVRASSEPVALNRQTLVVGIGTGFNVCVINSAAGGPVVNEAELGHASLASSVARVLHEALGAQATSFITNEHLFSGGGLERLFKILSEGEDLSGSQIVANYQPGKSNPATTTLDLFTKGLGVAARELIFQYLPYGGIYYAGGAARGIFASPVATQYLDALNAPDPFEKQLSMVPIHVLNDDAAALTGTGIFARMSHTP